MQFPCHKPRIPLHDRVCFHFLWILQSGRAETTPAAARGWAQTNLLFLGTAVLTRPQPDQKSSALARH